MCCHEVGTKAGLDGGFGQGDAQMRFADPRRAEKNHVTGLMDETQCLQFPNLPLIDRRLKTEIELIKVLHKRQMSQLESGPQIAAAPRIHLTTKQVPEKIRITRLGLRGLLQQILEPGFDGLQS